MIQKMQLRELRECAERRGWVVTEEYADHVSEWGEMIEMIPHVCPLCKGKKLVVEKMKEGGEKTVLCPTCDSSGVVWERRDQVTIRRKKVS
jgi:uncharacterized protein YbaR (Trm112 family)